MMAWNLAAALTGTPTKDNPPSVRKTFTPGDVHATLARTEEGLAPPADAIVGVAEQLGLIATCDATGDDSIDAEVAALLAGEVRYSEITLTIRCIRKADASSDFGSYLATLAVDDESSVDYGRIVLEATPAEREL